jgi:hypothetical protein
MEAPRSAGPGSLNGRLKSQNMGMIDAIQKFEKDFIEAGKLAAKLRDKAISSKKSSSGVIDIDIITSSDLEVQEFLLKKLASSELKNCELIAEEDTPSKKLFAKHSDLVLTIDPIDGTKTYATGGKYYSVIITLHDKKNPIYTFDYFPELNWGLKIVNESFEILGQPPTISPIIIEPKTITFSNLRGEGDPGKVIPDISQSLIKEGYKFKPSKEITQEIDSRMLFLLGITDGYFTKEDGSATDCLTILHFAQANNYKIFRNIDISKPAKSDSGGSGEYKGYYLVLREKN